MKELIAERGLRAPSHVRRAVDVERHSPTVGMLIALSAERVLRSQERSMNLARNHTAETEKAAHRARLGTCHALKPPANSPSLAQISPHTVALEDRRLWCAL